MSKLASKQADELHDFFLQELLGAGTIKGILQEPFWTLLWAAGVNWPNYNSCYNFCSSSQLMLLDPGSQNVPSFSNILLQHTSMHLYTVYVL